MRILIVEDNRTQADRLARELNASLPDAVIANIETEHEFREQLDDLVKTPPDIVIIDVMLRWTFPSLDMPERPPDVALHTPGTPGR